MNTRSIDDKQFVRLISENEGLLKKISRMYGRARDERADLLQEIVLQLWRAFPLFRQQSKAGTFIYRVALNTAISYNRKEQRHRTADIEIPDFVVVEDHEQEQVQQLYALIKKLDKLDRALIFLHFEGYRYKEIAEFSGLSETNVSTRISRIKKHLTETMQQLYLQ